MLTFTSSQQDQLMSDLRLVIADAEEILRLTIDQVSEGAAHVRARVESRLQQSREELARLQASVVGKARDAGNATQNFVEENPWKSIGIAAALGLLAGVLITRR